jgi:glyoxylase-like metal-dependent hydrolase (beta-lactamase superfamily II)
VDVMSVLLLPAGNPSAWTGPTGNNTYLLRAGVPTLIDAGVGAPAHLAAIEQALGGSALAAVLVTHGHVDHVGGIPAIQERWPSAAIRTSRDFADGETIVAGDGALRALHTPGHAPDHFCFFDESSGDLFCGDLLRRGGTVVIPASKGGDLTEYLRSLRRVRDLRPARLLPGHGPVVDDPDALIDEYIRHRDDRERQVIAALRWGCGTPEAIVARVYEGLPGSLVSAAADSVLAHLVKLEQEHVARRTGGRWTLTRAT